MGTNAQQDVARVVDARALRREALARLEESMAVARRAAVVLDEQGAHAEALDLMRRRVILFDEGMALLARAQELLRSQRAAGA